MRYAPVLLSLCCLYAASAVNAQTSSAIEKEIRQLEKAQGEAIFKHDTVALYKIWAEDFTVNSPTNNIVKLPEAKAAIRMGLIDYAPESEQILEEMMVYKDVVITMGREVMKPVRNAPMAGQTVNRRYTQVWMKRNGDWKLVARHANIVQP